MMTIPLWYFLIAYGGFLVVFVALMIINVYHIYSTGTFTRPVLVMFLFVFIMSIITLVVTGLFLWGADWSDAVRLGSAVRGGL